MSIIRKPELNLNAIIHSEQKETFFWIYDAISWKFMESLITNGK